MLSSVDEASKSEVCTENHKGEYGLLWSNYWNE